MNAPPVAGVLALGAANGRSIAGGLMRAGAVPRRLRQPAELHEIDALVIPGVANLSFVIDALDCGGWRRPIAAAIARGLPVLGICAGFQLLLDGSDEAPGMRGLGCFAGAARRMRGGKVPHMGWNRVESLSPAVDSGWAYFAHSFAAPPTLPHAAAITPGETPFASVAMTGRVIGVQFHPERSGAFGRALLERFVAGVREARRAG